MRLTNILPLLLLPACASITTGSSQSVLVDSTPPGAECSLSNDKGSWHVKSTPGSATVQRSASALNATCSKGKLTGSASAESTTEGAAFGNIIAGGIIGAAVDMSSGAAYVYPGTITVPLGKGAGR